MLQGLPALHKLINQLRHVPYLASKNVYRVALYFLTAEQGRIDQLLTAINEAKEAIAPCETCGNWAEKAPKCTVCADGSRDTGLVCVIEQWHDLYAIERAGSFRGVYHVLGGVLSPMEGIGPDELRVKELLDRVEAGEVREIIFATNPTPEGEATVSYLSSKLPNEGIMYSRLASGVPTGGSLSYMDRTTIHKALQGRQPL